MIWFLAAVVAAAADGPCYLQVEGHVYLDRICNIDSKFGTVSIGAGESAREPYFAYLEVEKSQDRAQGYWNRSPAENRAHVRLGTETLMRKGNCWVNEQATVCAGPR